MHRVNTQFDIVAFSFNFHSEVIGGSDGIDYFPMKVASSHEYVSLSLFGRRSRGRLNAQ